MKKIESSEQLNLLNQEDFLRQKKTLSSSIQLEKEQRERRERGDVERLTLTIYGLSGV